jgi:hypothetical protein
MAENQGRANSGAGPVIPFIDMEIRTAEASLLHFDQDIVDGRLGPRHVDGPQTRLRAMFDERLHTPFFIGLLVPHTASMNDRRRQN